MLLYHAVTGKITHATAVSAVTGQAGLLTHRETRKHEISGWRGSSKRYALWPVAAGGQWSLLSLSPLLSAAMTARAASSGSSSGTVVQAVERVIQWNMLVATMLFAWRYAAHDKTHYASRALGCR
jgi:hypothetical protein